MSDGLTMRDAFFGRLEQAMADDPRIVVLSADLGAPSLDQIRERFPERFFNVGIAEQNLVNVATGFAVEGFVVVAYAIAAFLSMRSLEQIRINLAISAQLRPLNVTLVGLGAGFSYDMSGPSHHCPEDLSLLRTLPNLDLVSPSDSRAAAAAVDYALASDRPKYVRLDGKLLPELGEEPLDSAALEAGFRVLRLGRRACLVGTGYMTHRAVRVADHLAAAGRPISVIDVLRFRGIDEAGLVRLLARHDQVVTLEEGFVGRGGLDSFIAALVRREHLQLVCRGLGLRDSYTFDLDSRDHLHELNGVGDDDVLAALDEQPPESRAGTRGATPDGVA